MKAASARPNLHTTATISVLLACNNECVRDPELLLSKFRVDEG